MPIFIITIFLGSFLSFSIQPLTGKIILPWFGGTNTVWSTVIFFYVFTLLIGYFYSHWLCQKKLSKQKTIHKFVMFSAVATLAATLLINKQILPQDPINLLNLTSLPYLQVLILLVISISIPYFLLSTTSTLLQSWHAVIHPNKSPHYLYSISNIGALLGLLSYPFLIEPNLTLHKQQIYWSILFFLYIILLFKSIQFKTLNKKNHKLVATDKINFIVWVALASLSSFVLISTSSTITQSITPTPFFWVVPLAFYLISYIIGFSKKVYQRQFNGGLLVFSIFLLLCSLNNYLDFQMYWASTAVVIFYHFSVCLVCHSELFNLKPDNSNLTSYYLAIAVGGALGTFFGAIIAPTFFSDNWELPISLVLATMLYFIIQLEESNTLGKKAQHFAIATLLIFMSIQYFSSPYKKIIGSHSEVVVSKRNFYSSLKVIKDSVQASGLPYKKTLINGGINHGFQNFNSDNTHVPTIYYAPDTSIGKYVSNYLLPTKPDNHRIGVIGLGVGAMAGYCNENSYFRFYEINPDVIDINKTHFTFLKNCQDQGGTVDIVLGDARTSLQKELSQDKQQNFDILVIDAFTDDAIPTHLLTLEAIQLFQKHLGKGGVLAFHISNRHLKLEDVLLSAAAKLNYYSFAEDNSVSYWFYISKDPTPAFNFTSPDANKTFVTPWTDDYSNLFAIIR